MIGGARGRQAGDAYPSYSVPYAGTREQIVDRFETAWWARLADGGLRRVWATRTPDGLHCLREEYTCEQEAARRRLARMDYRRGPDGRPDEGELLLDARVLADVVCAELVTPDLEVALEFLGGDEAARHALRHADPNVTASWPAPASAAVTPGHPAPDS